MNEEEESKQKVNLNQQESNSERRKNMFNLKAMDRDFANVEDIPESEWSDSSKNENKDSNKK